MMEPSFSGGMNSLPMRDHGNSVTTRAAAATAMVPQMAEHELDDGPVRSNEKPVDRIRRFGLHSFPNEQPHHDRHQREGEQRRRRHRQRLGPCERLEQPPLLRLQCEDRHEGNGDDQQRDEQRRADFLRRVHDELPVRTAAAPSPLLALVSLHVLVQILHHHDRRVDHRPNRDRDAAERHDVGAQPEKPHRQERHENADRESDDRHEGTRRVQKKEHRDQRDDDGFFHQLVAQRGHRVIDESRPIVPFDESHALGQRALQLCHFCLHPVDDGARIFAVAHHHPSGHDFSAAIQLRDTSADLRPDLHRGDVSDAHGRATRRRADCDVADIVEALKPAAAPHHVLGAPHLEHAPAHVLVRSAHRLGDALEGDLVREQLGRIDLHLILLFVAAQRCDLRDAGNRRQRGLHCPVLDAAQLRQVQLAAGVREDVLHHPADACCIRSERWHRASRQLVANAVQVLEHARTRPIQIGTVLEDDVHRRDAELAHPANELRARHLEHFRRQRIRHLILDDLRRLSRILRHDDDLRVRQIRNRVHGRVEQRPSTAQRQRGGAEKDREAVSHGPFDDAF